MCANVLDAISCCCCTPTLCNPQLATRRLIGYWETRYKVFGADKFALPITLDGAMMDCREALKVGHLYLLPMCDKLGRGIIHANTSALRWEHNKDDQIRVWWYLIHVVAERASARKNGYIILANAKDSTLHNFDTKVVSGICTTSDRIFPIRLKAIHCCNASPVFPLVSSVVKSMLSVNQRERFVLHNGSVEGLLASLSNYHLDKGCLPTAMGEQKCEVRYNVRLPTSSHLTFNLLHYCFNIKGGDLSYTHEDFLKERLEVERGYNNVTDEDCDGCSDQGQGQEEAAGAAAFGSSFPETVDSYNYLMTAAKKLESASGAVNSSKVRVSVPVPTSLSLGIDTGLLPQPVASRSNGQPNQNDDKPLGKKKAKSHPGRFGDPRMNLAVQAKQDNPSMPLLTALVKGGFVFPEMNKPGIKLSSCRDMDNVTVYQRRNQLLRRLRQEKQKMTNSRGDYASGFEDANVS